MIDFLCQLQNNPSVDIAGFIIFRTKFQKLKMNRYF